MAKLINGNGNPAIYAAEDADWFASIMGNQTSITGIGEQFRADQADANTIEVFDGVIITKEGRRIQLDANDVDLFEIPTGVPGTTSYYIIGYHLYNDENSNQFCEVFTQKMDTASETIPEDTFRGGADEVFVSLYRVTQDGLTISDIDLLLPTIANIGSNADDIVEIKLSLGNLLFRIQGGKAQYSIDSGVTWKNFSSGAVLVGTYSANTSINVSAYGATSANQFLIVPQSLSGSPSYSRYTGATGDNISFSCSFSSGSKSLSNNILSITAPTVSFSGTKKEGSANAFNISGSAVCSYSVYFMGN